MCGEVLAELWKGGAAAFIVDLGSDDDDDDDASSRLSLFKP